MCYLYSSELFHKLLEKLRFAIGVTVPIAQVQGGGAKSVGSMTCRKKQQHKLWLVDNVRVVLSVRLKKKFILWATCEFMLIPI